jgi:Uma2 family endonuclease
MASLPKSGTVTYEEWLRLPEVEDATEEVVNGEIRITPPAKWKHLLSVERLRLALIKDLDPNKVLVATGSFGLVIRKQPLTSRVPDLAVFELSTLIEQDGYIHSAPQLLVEVWSPANTRNERAEKLADYGSLGVPEVWMFFPERRNVEVFYLENGSLRQAQVLTEGMLKPKHFPDVQVDVSGIWPA